MAMAATAAVVTNTGRCPQKAGFAGFLRLNQALTSSIGYSRTAAGVTTISQRPCDREQRAPRAPDDCFWPKADINR
jgi:hypothetical protein